MKGEVMPLSDSTLLWLIVLCLAIIIALLIGRRLGYRERVEEERTSLMPKDGGDNEVR